MDVVTHRPSPRHHQRHAAIDVDVVTHHAVTIIMKTLKTNSTKMKKPTKTYSMTYS
jgi:hypothetical protein